MKQVILTKKIKEFLQMKRKMKKGIQKVDGFLKEFKSFALKKNVLDLAIAVVIGGAFGKIVTSLVNDVIMPLISLILGTEKFSDLKIILREGTQTTSQVTLNYGSFVQTFMDFFIIAFCIFIAIKVIIHTQKAIEKAVDKLDGIEGNLKPQPDPEQTKLTKDQELLTEIVTLLKTPNKDKTIIK